MGGLGSRTTARPSRPPDITHQDGWIDYALSLEEWCVAAEEALRRAHRALTHAAEVARSKREPLFAQAIQDEADIVAAAVPEENRPDRQEPIVPNDGLGL